MKKLLHLLWLLVLAIPSLAQTVNVTGTIIDANGNPYANGSVSVFLVTRSGVQYTYASTGLPANPSSGPFPTNSSGAFSIQIVPNQQILPTDSQYTFVVCANSVNLGPQPQPLLNVCTPPAGPIPVVAPGPQDVSTIINAVAPLLGPKQGAGGNSILCPGTINVLAKFTGVSTGCNSTVTDDGFTPTRTPNGENSAQGGIWTERTVGTGGVILGQLVCRFNVTQVITCPAGTTQGVLGVAGATTSAGNTVAVCAFGFCKPIVSNAATTGHWLIPSTSIAGDVDDTGSTVEPATGTQHALAESNAISGQFVVTALLSLDNLEAAAQGIGTIQACNTIDGLAYYTTGTTIACLTAPSVHGNYLVTYQLPTNTQVPPVAQLPGVPINAQTGASYTKIFSDRASLDTFNNSGAIAVTIPTAGVGDFTTNYVDANWNIGTGAATFTPNTSLVNGVATQTLLPGWFGFLYSNNINYFMPMMPTLSAFPSCTGSTNALQFNNGITCSSIAGFTLTPQNPNVALLGPLSSSSTNLVQGCSSTTVVSNNTSCTFTNNVTPGHLIVVLTQSFNGADTITSNQSDTFSTALTSNWGDNATITYTCNAVGGATTITDTIASNNIINLQAYEFTGNATTTCLDQTGKTQGTGGNTSSVTTTGSVGSANEIVVATFGPNQGGGPSSVSVINGQPLLVTETTVSLNPIFNRGALGNNNSGLSGTQTLNALGVGLAPSFWNDVIATFKLNTSGTTAIPTFRLITEADLPTGTPNPLFSVNPVGQTGAISDSAMTVASGTTVYQFNGTINCTTSSAAATATLNLKWTDTSSTAQTLSVTATCTTLGSASAGDLTRTISAKTGTLVTYGVTIANTPTYDLHARLFQLP